MDYLITSKATCDLKTRIGCLNPDDQRIKLFLFLISFSLSNVKKMQTRALHHDVIICTHPFSVSEGLESMLKLRAGNGYALTLAMSAFATACA
jgi:hypothetical protein